jgi:hypothetical protein
MQLKSAWGKAPTKLQPRRYGHKFATHKFQPRVRSKVKFKFRKPDWQK